jgi:hypothetical protein
VTGSRRMTISTEAGQEAVVLAPKTAAPVVNPPTPSNPRNPLKTFSKYFSRTLPINSAKSLTLKPWELSPSPKPQRWYLANLIEKLWISSSKKATEGK